MFSYVTYVAVEGLGNRLRTHFVAHAYALYTQRRLIVDWSNVKAFGVRFSELFELTDFSELKAFSVSAPFLKVCHKYSMQRFNGKVLRDNQTVKDLPETSAKLVVFGEAFYPWAYENNGAVLGEFHNIVLQSLKPRPDIVAKIETLKSKFSLKTVGIHIRRGDFRISFPDKLIPVRNYMAVARQIIKVNPDVKFFVATDDPDEIVPFLNEFDCIYKEKSSREVRTDPFEIFGYKNKCNRDTKSGAKEAVVDLYLLAATNLIVGSEHSSFSNIASFIGKSKLFIPDDHFFNSFDDNFRTIKTILSI